MTRLHMKTCLLMLFAFACTPAADVPVDPVWGKHACDHCMMLVSEPRPAAQATAADGSRKFFDDVGCLVHWLETEGDSARHVWVRAPVSPGWVDARAAKYRAGQRTPMDYGFLAALDGISFQELVRALRERRNRETGASR